LRLVALTDVSGYLEPCGCQSKLLGGIDRAAAKLNALRADRVPVLFVAAGDLLFGGAPEGATAETDATTQETWKAETLVEIFNRLGMVAATPGQRDLSFGAAELERLTGRSKFAWLPAKPGAASEPEAVSGTLTQAGDLQVGIVGVSTFSGPQAELPSDRLKALTQRAQTEVDRLRAAGARLVIALVSSDQRTGRRLSQGLHGLALTVQAGLDDAATPAPVKSGEATLLRGGRQGQGLLVVDVYLHGQAPFADVSEWTLSEKRADLQGRITDLKQRVQAWERDPKVDKAGLDEQRARLSSLVEELARLKPAAADSERSNAFRANYVALSLEQPKDPQITAILAEYDARVNEHNRVAFADVRPKPAPEGAASYVGSATCQGCHSGAYAWWTKHAHGRAYTTLENAHKQFNLSCVSCHVTGYGQPGGSSVVQNAGLTHVGCESCHGAGSLHAKQPGAAEHKLTAHPRETVCKQCHTPDHSDLFEFQTYVTRLRAKGHGLPLASK
jgi:2',3'-cyclic-nucleotide 2'-phosphodiesterase (5'-nucleotidase family)